MARVLLAWMAFAAVAYPGAEASAESTPDPARELELIESTERSEDPLGIDDSTGAELERAAARLPRPRATLPAANRGPALSAIDGVRESAHSVEVRLDQGLAFVTTRITLTSRAKHPAEVAYRLPLPLEAAVTSLMLCVEQRCRTATPRPVDMRGDLERAAAPPVAGAPTPSAEAALHAEPLVDAEGVALGLRVAPLSPERPLVVEVHYVAEAAVRGGRARFRLPARGYDPNLAPTQVRVDSRTLSVEVPEGERTLDPWHELEMAARVKLDADSGRSVSVVRARCGGLACARRHEVAPLAEPELRPTRLLLDASPSMEGPARGRASTALAALLSTLPEDTPLHVLAFAARTADLGRFRAADVPLDALADALLRDLDAATRPSLALRGADEREHDGAAPRIVVLSDGLFDPTPLEREALRKARSRGARLLLLAVGEHEPRFRDAFEVVVRVGELADRALHSGDLEPLNDALRVLASPLLERGLHAGEQRVEERRPRRSWLPARDAHWLSFWLGRTGPPVAWSTGAYELPKAAIAAVPYRGSPPPDAPPPATGLPAESVLSMLRSQLVPQARACLRSDRKGRGDYAVELTFHALFAHREVYEARVEGRIPLALRSCLEELLPKLRVPAFSGRIRVTYPIHTEREPPAPVIALEPEVSEKLERAFGRRPALP